MLQTLSAKRSSDDSWYRQLTGRKYNLIASASVFRFSPESFDYFRNGLWNAANLRLSALLVSEVSIFSALFSAINSTHTSVERCKCCVGPFADRSSEILTVAQRVRYFF